jgi:hypothetical protein
VTTGAVVHGPAETAQPAYRARLDGTTLVLESV